MKLTSAQRDVMARIGDGYHLGSYFAPPGQWSLSKNGVSIIISKRTVLSMHRKGFIAGNIYWPYVTALAWKTIRGIKESQHPAS